MPTVLPPPCAPATFGLIHPALRRAFSAAFLGALDTSRPLDRAGLQQVRAALEGAVDMLDAEQDLGLAETSCPDSAFGSEDLRRAACSLLARLQEPGAEETADILGYWTLLHGELLVAMYVKEHEVQAWLDTVLAREKLEGLRARYADIASKLSRPRMEPSSTASRFSLVRAGGARAADLA